MDQHRPLADILRPQKLDDVIGQEHLVGSQGVIRKLLATDFLPSLILWGPPGCGKTTLAQLLAKLTDAHFESHSAVTSTLVDVRRVIKESNAIDKRHKDSFFLMKFTGLIKHNRMPYCLM